MEERNLADWFKMKINHEKMIEKLPAESAKNVLLACFYFLRTGETREMPALDECAFYAIFPELEEAIRRCATARENGAKGGRPPKN